MLSVKCLPSDSPLLFIGADRPITEANLRVRMMPRQNHHPVGRQGCSVQVNSSISRRRNRKSRSLWWSRLIRAPRLSTAKAAVSALLRRVSQLLFSSERIPFSRSFIRSSLTFEYSNARPVCNQKLRQSMLPTFSADTSSITLLCFLKPASSPRKSTQMERIYRGSTGGYSCHTVEDVYILNRYLQRRSLAFLNTPISTTS